MRLPIYLTMQQVNEFQYEYVSQDLKNRVARLLMKDRTEHDKKSDEKRFNFIYKIVNICKAISSDSPIILYLDEESNFDYKHTRIEGMFYSSITTLNNIEFIEFLCELAFYDYLSIDKINESLNDSDNTFKIDKSQGQIIINVIPEKLSVDIESHPNIHMLINRMDTCFSGKDYSGVLAASNNVLETLAKIVLDNKKFDGKTLGDIFGDYKEKSSLPIELKDLFIKIYIKRNAEPSAGHGSRKPSTITRFDANFIVQFTKAVVNLEYDAQTTIN
jgi:hypothetical protein